MLSKERKKHTGSNINININLKVESKHPTGRKINKEKELQLNNQAIRPTGQLYKQKKYSCQELPPHKQSVQHFLQDKSIRYEINDQNCNAINRIEKVEPPPKPHKLNSRKRAKSKSLENIKVKYYARTPEPLSKSNSKINSKSKSKSKLTSKSKSKINSKSRSKSKKKYADTEKSSPRQFLHSSKKEKSKSKSKSPLMSKKRSLQTFRLHSREIEREKSKEKKWEKNVGTGRKNQASQPSFEKVSKVNIHKKEDLSHRIQNRKSKDKIKTQSPSKNPKPSTVPTGTKPKHKKSKKPKQQKIFPPIFLERMATKIQSFWRGYIVRKHFKEQLNQITAKITSIRNNFALKREDFWQTSSNHSIILLESSSGMGSRTQKNMSERSNSESLNPQFMIELQKLRKKLQEQQDRFRLLAEQNNQLKANLSKISKQPESTEKKMPERPLIVNNNVISMRIQSEESQLDPQDIKRLERKEEARKRIRQKMLSLPAAIKTQESREQYDIAELKKKVQSFECSPKNQDCTLFKFNKKLIKKLFTHQEQKINQKYFKKNTEFRNLLENQLISPKTYNQRWSQLELKLKKERQDTMKKFKEAEKAMLLVAELQQEEQNSSQIQQQNLNKNGNDNARQSIGWTPEKKSSQSSLHSSPGKKTVNLFINVDEIETNHEKYTPIFTHNAHREIELQKEQDLSQLYHKVMEEEEKKQSKQIENTIQVTVESQEKGQNMQGNEVQRQSKKECTEVVNIDIAHYPDFQLAGDPQPLKIRGFQTSLKYIREFYIRFCEFFRQIPVFRQQILQNIVSQIIFDTELYLRSFRMVNQEQSEGQLIFPYFKYLATYNTTIPVHILNSFYSELTNQDSQLFSKETYQLKMTSKQEYQDLGYSSYELKQYYDLALIDAFNEAINFQRPGGAEASNLDELTHHYRSVCKNKVSKKLLVELPRERQDNLSSILGNTIGRIVNIWACSLCGFINDNMDEDDKIDEEQVEEIRTKRLTLLLEKSLIEEESSVVNLHPFGLYVKLEVANLVAEELGIQFALEMSNKNRRV